VILYNSITFKKEKIRNIASRQSIVFRSRWLWNHFCCLWYYHRNKCCRQSCK